MKCSNGNDGQYIESLCSDCKYGDNPCPIAYVHFEYGYDACKDEAIEKVLNLLISDKTGKCNMKEVIEKAENHGNTTKCCNHPSRFLEQLKLGIKRYRCMNCGDVGVNP